MAERTWDMRIFLDDLSIYGHLTNNTRPKKYGASYLKSQTNGRLEEEYMNTMNTLRTTITNMGIMGFCIPPSVPASYWKGGVPGFPADWDQQQDMDIFCNKHGWFWWMSQKYQQLFWIFWPTGCIHQLRIIHQLNLSLVVEKPENLQCLFPGNALNSCLRKKKSSCARSVCEVGPFHHSQTGLGFGTKWQGCLHSYKLEAS